MDKRLDQLLHLRGLPLFWSSLAFVAGILFASAFPNVPYAWLLVAAALGAAVLRRRVGWLAAFALVGLTAALLGAARWQSVQPMLDESSLAFYNDDTRWVEARGVLIEPPLNRAGYAELRVAVDQIEFAYGEVRAVSGLLLARVDLGGGWLYGDRVEVYGQLLTPEEDEDFSYRAYLAGQGIHSLMPFASATLVEHGRGFIFWSAVYGLRQHGVDTLRALYPSQEAALLSGILLGDESGLSDELKTAFNDTGTRHIIAISGFNITILAGFLLAAGKRWLGQGRAMWAAGIGIAFYTLLVGADASVVRAAIMGVIGLVALQTGRQTFAINSLAITGAAMAFVNPLVLWDVGFQLSFAATLGIVSYATPMREWAKTFLARRLPAAWAKRLQAPLNDYLLITLAAQITTLPLLLFHFGRLPLFSLPANLLILPVQPALMMVGGVSLLFGMLWLPLGQMVSWLGWMLAAYTIRIVELIATLPGAAQAVPQISVLALVVACTALTLATYAPLRTWLLTLRIRPAFTLATISAASLWVWGSAMAAPDGLLRLTLLDVEGEGILIESPSGRSVLINTGSSALQLEGELSRELAFGQTLDWLLIAGRRPEQIGGLDARTLSAASVAVAGEGEWFSGIAAELGGDQVKAGDSFDLGDGAQLQVLAVGQRGAALLLTWENFSALLPTGLDFEATALLQSTLTEVDVMLLADGGYLPLNSPEWIAAASPEVLLATGDPEVESFQVLATQDHGWITITTDGDAMWIEAAH